MENELSRHEWSLILESLKHSKLILEKYEYYPSIEYKMKKVEELNSLIIKIKDKVT